MSLLLLEYYKINSYFLFLLVVLLFSEIKQQILWRVFCEETIINLISLLLSSSLHDETKLKRYVFSLIKKNENLHVKVLHEKIKLHFLLLYYIIINSYLL